MKKIHLGVAAILLASACGSSVESGDGGSAGASSSSSSGSTSTGTSTPGCEPGTTYQEPGCGDPSSGAATITAGCYASCTALGAPCATGGSCQKANVNPCICTGDTCCGACGAEVLLCLP